MIRNVTLKPESKKFPGILFLVFFLLAPSSYGDEELPPLPPAPLVLTSARPEHFSPDYWVGKLPNPDKPLLTEEQLKRFNEGIHQELSDAVDLFAMESARSGKSIRDQIRLEFKAVRGRKLYGVDDKVVPKTIFDEMIKPLEQVEKIPAKIKLRWGTAVRPASVRSLPSPVKMFEKLRDYEFDMLQFTQIKLWTPVAIYHTSSDGKWFYLQAPYIRGWVQSKDIALFETRSKLQEFVKSKNFLVVTGESVPIFSDASVQDFFQRASMGTILPLAGKTEKADAVWMPFRGEGGKVRIGKAYLHRKSDVSAGFPAYTPRNIIHQAFKLLGARYGWGGTYNGRDCSGFIQDIFLSVGVEMPRASKWQSYVGTQIDHFKPYEDAERKAAAIRSGFPGVTLLTMPMHQMIYLGEENGQFYVIHSTWAERVSMTSDQKLRVNQVVVSDLTLNGNSYLGSLFDRIISVNEVT